MVEVVQGHPLIVDVMICLFSRVHVDDVDSPHQFIEKKKDKINKF